MAVIPERPEALEDIQPREIPQLWKHENPDEVTALKIAIQAQFSSGSSHPGWQ